MVRTIILAMLALAGPLSLASAQMGGPPPAPEPFIPDVDEETWVYQFPEKWAPYSSETDIKQTTVLFPYGQKPASWKESLKFEHFTGTMGATQARQLYDLSELRAGKECESHEIKLIAERIENGYSAANWSLKCNLAAGSVLFTLNKAIVGSERLYMGTKTWKRMPKEDDLQEWQAYFRQAYVCDPRTEVNPCLPPNGPPGGGQRPGGGPGER